MAYDYHGLFEEIRNAGLNPLGSVYTSLSEVFKLPVEEQRALKAGIIAENFRFHYENNAYYRGLCEQQGVTPSDIRHYDDLIKIPLIPVSQFKRTDTQKLLTLGLDKIEVEMRSTGTSGIPSVTRRDSETVTQGSLALWAMYREFFMFSSGAILFLMPSPEEVLEMGMIRVSNMLAGLVDTGRFLVRKARFEPQETVALLTEWENEHIRHIVGPPFLVYKIVRYLKKQNIHLRLDRETLIINLGGWKRFSGEAISREEYNRECAEYLGVKPDQIRDMYGLIEGNAVAIECDHHWKHVPPWVHFSVREIEDFSKEVTNGRRGVLAIIDPTCLSYPAYILTEDVAELNVTSSCPCGRNGQRVNIIGRLTGSELGCCAINLDKAMDVREKASIT
ncbi:MAG: LuxE family acyl-protein synthetase [Chloroflexi bacterium]|nr:LuxE family acyl-protein synthetase [Chloroflexota bacterium]